MDQENITPIHHSGLGSVGGTVGGAIGGGIKTGAKSFLLLVGVGALVGAVLGTGLLGAAAGGTLLNVIFGGVLGGAAGGLAGSFISPIAGLFGAAKGGAHANARIREERGAAAVLDAQLAAYQAQAYAAAQQPTTIYAPSASNNTTVSPEMSNPMNQASPRIAADSAQNLGTINGLQLQRA